MYSGSLFWNELTPRIRTVVREPGDPLFSTVTPATWPSSRWSTLVEVCWAMLATSTLDSAPVMSCRRCVVYPVTTTSGSTVTARSMTTSTLVRPPTLTPTPRYPMRANTNTASVGAVSEYFPAASVTALVVVPRMWTEAPRIRSPSGAVTLPEISICCWPTAVAHTSRANVKLVPTARRNPLRCSMSFMAVPSSCGSSHGLEALLGDQLAIRDEQCVSGLHGPGARLTDDGSRPAGEQGTTVRGEHWYR